MSFRIINTAETHLGKGIRYVHDAARPFAVLFASKRGEICALRCPTMDAAKAAMIKFTDARTRYANRNAVEPRTAAGSLD